MIKNKYIDVPIRTLVLLNVITLVATGYLVQVPLEFWGLHTTWGTVVSLFIFVACDLTVRFCGVGRARVVTCWAMAIALPITYVVSLLFRKGVYQGIEEFTLWNPDILRISVASYSAYLISQLINIKLYDWFQHETKWWLAPMMSTTFGNIVDTFIFFAGAFYMSSNVYMAEHWPEVAVIDYVYEFFISLLIFLPMYKCLLHYIEGRIINRQRIAA